MKVSKRFSFDAAHFLPNYEGKCHRVHGHHWEIELACEGKVDEEKGMVVDFAELGKFCKIFRDRFDHVLLNDIIQNPTAENICRRLFGEFYLWCKARDLDLGYIRVWETEDNMVELKGEKEDALLS